MKPRRLPIARLSFPLASALAALFAVSYTQAATYYWDNNGTTAGFGAATGTWDGAGTVGSGTQGWGTDATGLIAPTGTITTLSTNATTDAINFGTATAGLGAGTITVAGTVQAGAITFGAASGAITLSGGTAINLAATSTITVNNATNTIGTALTGAATGFTKAGSGILVLTGTNTYSGATTISAGTLRFSSIDNAGNNSSLGNFATAGATGILLNGGRLQYTGASGVSVNRGVTLTATSTIDIDAASTSLTLGASSMAASTLNVTSGGTGSSLGLGALTLTGAATLNPTTANLTVASVTATAQNLTLGGTSSGNTVTGAINTTSGTLTKNTASTWTLSGSNGYTGVTTISAGLLRVDGSLNASSAVTVSGGAIGGTGTVNGSLSLTTNGGINLANGSVGGTAFTVGGTLLSSGAAGLNNLTFDLASGGSTTDQIVASGAFNMTNAGAVVISPNQLGGSGNRLTAGTYDILTAVSGSALSVANGGNFRLATTKAFGQTFSLASSTSTILKLTTTQVAAGALNKTLSVAAGSWAAGASFGGTVPDYQSNVTINSATGTTPLDGSTDINSLTYGTSATTATTISPGTASAGTIASMLVIEAAAVNGNTAGNGITLSNTSGTHTISANVGLAASQTWTVATGAGLTASGVISDFGGGYGLTKEGGGTLTLSGVNTFTGPLTIANGTLRADSATLGNKGGNGLLGAGTTIVMGGSGTTGRLAVKVDGGVTIDKDITLATGGTGEFQFGNVSFPDFTITNADRFMTLSGNISGSGNFTKLGGAAIALSGNNTYTGTTTINEGSLRLNSATALPGGIGATGGTSALTINGNNITNTGNIGAVVALTAASGDFMRALGTGADQFQITGGVSGFEANGSARQVIVGNNAAFELQWGIPTFNPSALLLGYNSVTANGALTLQNKIDLNAATRTIQVNQNAAAVTATISGDIRTSIGTAGLTVTGGGTLILSGSNTYNGPTTISAGTLSVGASNNLGTGGNVVFNGSTLQITGTSYTSISGGGHAFTFNPGTTATLDINNAANTFTADQVLTGAINFTKAGAGTLVFNQANTYTGVTTISAGTLRLDAGGVIATPIANNSAFTVNSAGAVTQGTNFGLIGGTGTLTKTLGGTLTLNLANTFTGTTTVSAGTIAITNALALQNSAYDTTGSNGSTIGLNVTSGLSSNTLTLGGLAGSVNLNSAFTAGFTGTATNLTLNPQSGSSPSYGGIIANTTMSLTKTGAGTQTLTNTNTYTGATTINTGTLTLSGAAGAIASTTINLNGGGLTLSNTAAANSGARVSDSATVTVNGNSALTFTHTAGVANYAETINTLDLQSGFLTYTGSQAAGGQTSNVLFNTLSRSGTATVNFAGTGLGTNAQNTIKFGAGVTNGVDLGPWAVVNGANFATYDTTLGIKVATSSTLAAGSNSSTTNFDTTAGSITLTAALNPSYKTLLVTGGTARTTAIAGNTVSVGGISSTGATHIINGTGAVQALTAGDALYINVGANTLQFDSVIQNVGAGGTATTLVKSGGGTLTLTNAGNTYSGGTVINGGTLSTSANGQLGTGGGIIVNGTSTWNLTTATADIYNRTLTINSGTLTLNSGNNTKTFTGVLSGSGGLVGGSSTGYIFNNTGNTFTGTVDNGYQMIFASIGDSSNPFNLVGSNSEFQWTGGAKAFALRPLTLNAAGTGNFNNNGTGAVTFAQNLAFSGATGARTLALGGTYTGAVNQFSGNIADGPGSVVSITKSGAGTWSLSGSNTYTGTTTVSAGTLQVSSLANGLAASSIGASSNAAGNLLLANATTLRYTGSGHSTDRSFTLNVASAGNGAILDASGTGAINFTNTASPAYGTASQTRTLTLTGTNTGNNTLAANIGDNTSSAVSITKSGIGTWVLSGANVNTGATALSGGGALVLDYGTNNTNKIAGVLTLGGGTLTLKGATGNHLEDVTSTSLNAGGTFLTRDGANTAKLNMNVITRAAGGTISFGSASLANTDTNNINSILGGYATLGNDWAVSVNSGAADTSVTALGTYSTWVNTTGSATANYLLNGAGSIVTSGVAANTVKITNSANSETLALNNLNLTITATSATSLGGIMYAGGSDNLYSITGGTGRIQTSTANQELVFAVQTGTLSVGAFVGASGSTGPVTKSGAGTLAISSLNNYTGATYVNQGVLQLRSATAAGTATNTLNAGIIVQNNAALELANSAIIGAEALTITGTGVSNGGALRNVASNTSSYAGAITIGTGGARINSDGTLLTLSGGVTTSLFNNVTFGGAGNTTVSTVAISGAGGLVKDGAGTTTLATGTTHTYTGATTVSDGKLVVNGNISTSVLTTVQTGATLGGSGTVGALTINASGFHNPGNSPAIQNTGNYSLAGSLGIEITGNTPGVGGYDQVNTTGSVTLSGLLAVTMSYTPGANELFFILVNDSTDAIAGVFSNAPTDGSTYTFGGQDFQISYFGNQTSPGIGTFTGGNDVVLMAIPEPNVAALLGGLGALMLLRRRRN